MRRHLITATATAAVAVTVLAAAATASAGWVIHGHGFGHGVGMSQWGADGYAKHGRGYRWILEHYYQHTRVDSVGPRKIRVLLDAGPDPVRFSGATKACGMRLRAARSYEFDRKGDEVFLRTAAGKRLAKCGSAGTAAGGTPIHVNGQGDYRGRIEALVWPGSGLEIVNKLDVDSYARGVVPNEMPSSWPRAALRAQAVAARSYALASAGSGDFDVYDDTRSQVYGGVDTETPATDRAVKDTAGEVLRYSGGIATTYFFSSSGGMTENVEYGFPGADPQPYLKAVRDRYDDLSPDHSWTVRLTQKEMASRLAGLYSGRLRRIEILKRGVSPRIVTAKVVGSAGSTKVSGPALQFRLRLKSTWARFKRR